ncbi:MAG TPA: hypothetical protein VMF91_25435 [Bryobacteraceae bacterium]|nr:hypothetical protein [Bryobacteraceae bacterium]
MTLDAFIRYGSLWTVMLGVVSLLFAIRNYRRQVNAQIFFEIAKRYHEMLQSFPIYEWTTRLSLEHLPPESSLEVKAGVLRYLATVHFAFTLHELRYLSRDLWKILQSEHHRTLAAPLFVREWRAFRSEFILFPSFLRYVEAIQRASIAVSPDSVIVQPS